MTEPGRVGPDETVRRRAVPTEDIRLPDVIVRWKPVERIDTDLMVGASPHALFYRGVDTVSTRRAIYHQYEQGRLLGAFKHGSLIASRKSTVLAAMWAEETKKLDARTVQLMELHLQLRELAAALEACDGDRAELNKLNALLEATEAAIGEALKILSPCAIIPERGAPLARIRKILG